MKIIWQTIFLTLYVICVPVSSQTINHWETAVFNSDTWRFQVGFAEPDSNWRSLSFNDKTWYEGKGGFGYGDNDDGTIIAQYKSVFLRIKFNIADTSVLGAAILHIDYDDGFVAYLNDHEVARRGVQGIHPAFSQLAESHEAGLYKGVPPESFYFNGKDLHKILLNGENILAVQVHNSSGTSDDLSSNVWLSFGLTPGSHFFRDVPSWFSPLSEFTSSSLPIVIIKNKPGTAIVNEPKVTADLKIIRNSDGVLNNVSDTGNIYTGSAGIEYRGRYSLSLPQKPFGFETRDAAGNNLNVPILGMPAENDWILTANYNDKTFLRNFLAFEIFREMGYYAPRTVYCEVVQDGQYQGIYLLGEKIKQDRNRVDIAKLNPDENSGDDLTGGYIFANDYYTSTDSWMSYFSPLNRPGTDVYFVYYEPDPEKITEAQRTYLKDYIDSFEKVLYSPGFKDQEKGYRAYLDVNSFVDYFILGEVTRNVDAYKKSRFFYKDKDSKDRRIFSGPPWDFDWAWRDIKENCINFNQTDGSGWAFRVNDCNNQPVPPSWEVRLMQDSRFAAQVNKRYSDLRKTVLSEINLNRLIDSVAGILWEAQERHFEKWKILGKNVGTPEYGEQPITYSGEITKLKNWIKIRLNWLDMNIITITSLNNEVHEASVRIFPVPASDVLNIEADIIMEKLEVFSITGKIVLEDSSPNEYNTEVNVSHLDAGLYIIRIHFKSGEIVSQRFIKN